MLQGFIAPVPPVEYQKSVNTGPCDDELTHETLANIRLAKLTGESNTAANHHTSTDAQIFHHCIVDGTCCVVEEGIHAAGAGFLHSCREIGGLLVVDRSIKADFAAPFELVVASGNGHRTTAPSLAIWPTSWPPPPTPRKPPPCRPAAADLIQAGRNKP